MLKYIIMNNSVYNIIFFVRVMKKAAIYARVSSIEQAGNTSIKTQLKRCESFALAKNFKVIEEYCDEGYSGKNFERPEFKRMISDFDKFEIIICYSLDRFSRSTLELLKVIQSIREKGKKIYFLNPLIDVNDNYGEFFITILSALAQLERNMILDRTKSGTRQRFSEGKIQNRPPFGYKKDGKIDHLNALKVKRIFSSMKSRPCTFKEMSKRFKMPVSTIRFILNNRFYFGEVRYGKDVCYGNHKPIISRELFEEVQKILCNKK